MPPAEEPLYTMQQVVAARKAARGIKQEALIMEWLTGKTVRRVRASRHYGWVFKYGEVGLSNDSFNMLNDRLYWLGFDVNCENNEDVKLVWRGVPYRD